jgi:hypothetical protein
MTKAERQRELARRAIGFVPTPPGTGARDNWRRRLEYVERKLRVGDDPLRVH